MSTLECQAFRAHLVRFSPSLFLSLSSIPRADMTRILAHNPVMHAAHVDQCCWDLAWALRSMYVVHFNSGEFTSYTGPSTSKGPRARRSRTRNAHARVGVGKGFRGRLAV